MVPSVYERIIALVRAHLLRAAETAGSDSCTISNTGNSSNSNSNHNNRSINNSSNSSSSSNNEWDFYLDQALQLPAGQRSRYQAVTILLPAVTAPIMLARRPSIVRYVLYCSILYIQCH